VTPCDDGGRGNQKSATKLDVIYGRPLASDSRPLAFGVGLNM